MRRAQQLLKEREKAFLYVHCRLQYVAQAEFVLDEGNIDQSPGMALLPPKWKRRSWTRTPSCWGYSSKTKSESRPWGRTNGGRILVVVFTFRGEAIRPITAYDAAKRDQAVYLKGSSV